MKRGLSVAFVLIVVLLLGVTAHAEKKAYCLSAVSSAVNSRQQSPIAGYADMPTGESSDDGRDVQKIYFAEGTLITIDDSCFPDDGSDLVTFDFPWIPGAPVRIDRRFLVPAEAYQKVYEPPKMAIDNREAMFASPWDNDHTIVTVLEPGEEAVIIAVIGSQFLVNVDGACGYIRQDAGPFKQHRYTYAGTHESGRVYDLKLVYYEPFFESAEKAGADERPADGIDEETAVACALAYARERTSYDKYLSEGYRLNTSARLNYAHRNSALGVTWQVIIYGDFYTGIPIESAFFVSFDDPDKTALLLPTDIEKTVLAPPLDQMTEEHWQMLRRRFGEDIRERYVYYFFEVSIKTGEVIMDEIFIDTPYSRIALF